MGDPVGAARHALAALKPDGTVLLVEPFAGDDLAENANPVGRLFYAASTFICTPNSLSQEVGLGLGAQAGEARLRACSPKRGLPSSGARRRRRSTSCWRRGRSPSAVPPSHRTQGAGPALTTRLDASGAAQGWPFVRTRRGRVPSTPGSSSRSRFVWRGASRGTGRGGTAARTGSPVQRGKVRPRCRVGWTATDPGIVDAPVNPDGHGTFVSPGGRYSIAPRSRTCGRRSLSGIGS